MKKVAALLALTLASLTLVACGGGSDSSSSTSSGGESTAETTTESKTGAASGGASTALEFEADPEGALAYTTTEATAKAGNVEIDFNNPQALTHDVAIEDSSGNEIGKTELIASSSDSTTVELEPGTYTFYCTVPGHREAGMEGTLTVK